MEFNQKLQELRKQKGITQEQLAEKLYVSRAAISKWESGRGYPGIDSIKAIAKFFSVTVDELLSSDEVLEIAKNEQKQKESRTCDLVIGLLDICMSLLLFLPFFAERTATNINNASLLTLGQIQFYLKALYFTAVIGITVTGVLILALQNCKKALWIKGKNKLSFALSSATVLLFVISLQPYAAVFSLVLLAIKLLVIVKLK